MTTREDDAYESPLTYEFASGEWLGVFGSLAVANASLNPDPAVNVACEVYLNAPTHISPEGTIAWTRYTGLGNNRFSVSECADHDADFKILGDYHLMRDLARFVITEETHQEFEDRVNSALGNNDIRVIIDRRTPREDTNFSFHNLIAKITR